jgi:hypoxanthine phosphoribosyltransferase
LPQTVDFDFMAVSSYGAGKTSSGEVRILKDLDSSIEGRRILVVEDIIDSGATLQYLMRLLNERQPGEVRVVTLLRKPAARALEIGVDWVGFDIPDEFVVGYGLDFAGKYRNLPFIAALQAD